MKGESILAFLFFTLFYLQPTVTGFRQQSVGVRGRLLCGNQSLSNTQIKLWNKNKIGTDDQLAAMKTRADGSYELQGGIGSIFGMDVVLKIYHDCDDGIKPCQRKVVLGIPSDYVTRSSNVKRWFDAGVLNMQFKFPDEERSCIN
ncbi:Transthyretin-like family protein [Onchocerca flexuosa]|uniref:Transthyretin-like family protein n=2 Tax=Onchocerca flexuosa TaxID=387005 RepID=A0A238BRE2_9BILA|nr:Transthyretin-like family protein [Onchocerca flexuosa]